MESICQFDNCTVGLEQDNSRIFAHLHLLFQQLKGQRNAIWLELQYRVEMLYKTIGNKN